MNVSNRGAAGFLFALFVALLRPAVGAEPVFVSPQAAKADPDFLVQGEYVGEGMGVQVVALGRGQFTVVSYRGGLPGAGWDGKEKQAAEYDREEVKELVAEWKKIERISPTIDAKPPSGAVVLFDGSAESLGRWQRGAKTVEGLLAAGCTSVETFRDFTLHLEFRLPFMPEARGQARGNSGVYLPGRHEAQVLDSFGLEGKDNECGGIYSVKAPSVNMCLPPLVWQTYDIDFTAARRDAEGKKSTRARLTVKLNGVVVQQGVELPRPTSAPLAEGPQPEPIYLQDHGSPVRYRNIWLLPRDIEREARRPIVPGFERFYATAGADKVEGGRLLLGELNCTGCHAAGDGLSQRLIKRQPPLLDGIPARVLPAYAVSFIADPHGTKPGTPMPDLLAGKSPAERQASARALTSFLFGAGRPREQPGNRQFAKHGEQLFHQLGCVACHEPRAGARVADGSSVPLGELTAKYTVASLLEFLKNPHQVRPSRRMPSFNLNNEEARDLACYLVGDAEVRPRLPNVHFAAYDGAWPTVPDFTKLTPYKQGEATGLDLDVAERSSNFGVLFTSFLKIDRGGRYTFHIGSDDGSVLMIDGKKVADSDGVHPHQVGSGSIELKRGMHPIGVGYTQGGGEWTLDLEIEGPGLPRQSVDMLLSLTDQPPPVALPAEQTTGEFVYDPPLVERGRELFATLGCAACHPFKVGGRDVAAKLASKPLANCDPAKGCLASSAHGSVPDFSLTTVQQEALAAAMKAPPPSAPLTPAEQIAATMTAFNCYACHARDGRGGPTADRNPLFVTTIPEMGDEGRVPPPLDGAGDKLQEGWLRHLLEQGAKDRPYMLTRMPKFAATEVVGLAEAFRQVDQRREVAMPRISEPPSRVKSTGRFLVGDKALACIKCHSFGEHRATGIQAINLQTMTSRVRYDWFQRYLPDPPKFRPGTRMPSGFTGGRSTISSVYNGDPARQIAAIWMFLSDGSKAGIPDGLIADVIELKPRTRPIIYRNFIDGLSPRGIAVGYPEKTNLAWDANQLSLTLLWHGRFIDASKHWEGRGAGFQTPLGDHVVRFEQTASIAPLASLETTWPTQPPKERGYQFRGYQLDARGRPTFRYTGPAFSVEDSPLPVVGSSEGYFERHLTIEGNGGAGQLFFLAGAGEIKVLDSGEYLIDDGVRVRLRPGNGTPVLRTSSGRQELLVPVLFDNRKAEMTQVIHW